MDEIPLALVCGVPARMRLVHVLIQDSFHNTLFGSTLILGVTVVFLIQHINDSAVESSGTEGSRDGSTTHQATAIYAAKWTISVSLSLALMNQTLIALLNRSLDPPGTLKIDNRHLRLLPRILLIPILLCLPISKDISILSFLGSVSGLLLVCLQWEWWSSLERGGGIIET